ncbi:FmdB family zinc ribbon protein [Enteractinococcus fodinae]|nr:zinc ribbon domain-containing protein [Enteractinococcus fodinae]
MPLYDYRCPQGDVFEAFFTMHDKPDTLDCPHCGQRATSKLPAIGPSQRNSAQMRILDATNATAETPQVVNSLTGTPNGRHHSPQYSTNPLHQKLPRP